eukprot:2797897-Amphidinium_carterae.1
MRKDVRNFTEHLGSDLTRATSRMTFTRPVASMSAADDTSPGLMEPLNSLQSPGPQMRSQFSRASTPKLGTSNHISFRAASRVSICNGLMPRAAIVPHEVFSEIITTVSQTDFSGVKMLVDNQRSTMMVVRSSSTFYYSRTFLDCLGAHMGLPMHPMSAFRLSFDSLSSIMLTADSVLVPYLIAWEIKLSGWPLFFAWFLAIFWSFDLLLNLCTGYMHNHELIMKWSAIHVCLVVVALVLTLPRYLRGGFLLDGSVLAIDYMELLGTFHTGEGGSLQLLRFLRVAKITRMVRVIMKLRCGLLARFDVVYNRRLESFGLTEYAHSMHFAAVLIKLLIFIAWLSHVGACMWFYFERKLVDGEDASWLVDLDNRGTFQSDYARGLYWSVSIMFSGASFIAPTNVPEGVFAAACISVSALFVTSITSNLAAILIEAQEAQQEMKKKVVALNTFMDQRGISPLLAIAVNTNFLARMSSPARLTELDIPQLDLLRKELRGQLREEQYGQHMISICLVRALDIVKKDRAV